jgi:hypothetical protein
MNPQIPKKMKTLNLFCLMAMVALAAACTSQRTVVQGPVIFADSTMVQPYFALIYFPENEDCEKWQRWEPWEDQDIYNIGVVRGQKVEAMWLAKCDFDTLATLTVIPIRGKQKVIQDTLVLDGSHYVKGAKYEKVDGR